MKSGIYEIVDYYLIRENSYVEIKLESTKDGKEETIIKPLVELELMDIVNNEYLLYIKIGSKSITQVFKTIDEAESGLHLLENYYSLGVTL